jgi:hypothetical protein
MDLKELDTLFTFLNRFKDGMESLQTTFDEFFETDYDFTFEGFEKSETQYKTLDKILVDVESFFVTKQKIIYLMDTLNKDKMVVLKHIKLINKNVQESHEGGSIYLTDEFILKNVMSFKVVMEYPSKETILKDFPEVKCLLDNFNIKRFKDNQELVEIFKK